MSDGVRKPAVSFSEGTITQQISRSKEEVPLQNKPPAHPSQCFVLLAKPLERWNSEFGVGVRS